MTTRRTYDAPTRAAYVAEAVREQSISAVSKRHGIPYMTLRQWVEHAAPGALPPSERALFNEAESAALAERLRERDARNARRPAFSFEIDLLGDPPPGRSALDQRARAADCGSIRA